MTNYSDAEKVGLDFILPKWGQEPKPLDELTVAELENLTTAAFTLKDEIEVIERELSRKKEVYNEATRKIQEYLNFHGKEKYACNQGTIDIRKKLSFKVPKTQEEKKAYFGWLQSKGIFLQYASVNSVSHNALMKDFWDPENNKWKEPMAGVEPPSEYEKIYFTKR